MKDLERVWRFTRLRLSQAIDELSEEQLRWRPHSRCHCILEILFHIAGAEHFWSCRIAGEDPAKTEYDAKLDAAIRDGFLAEGSCPFDLRLETKASALKALQYTEERYASMIAQLTEEQRAKQLVNSVGEHLTGNDALSRITQHAAYHTGQIWLLRMDPRFPAA